MAAVAATSLIVGLMSAFVPTTAAMAFDWSGPRTDAGGAAAASADVAPAASTLGRMIVPKMAPGNPGVPSDPEVVFEEDFENVDGTAPVLLTDYVGVDGNTYTAAAPWLQNCNGIIVNFNVPSTNLGNCTSEANSAHLRQIVQALGQHGNPADPNANDAVAAYTEGNPGPNQSEFETVDPISLATASGRFLTFSVDAAAKNCFASAPLYQFSFLSEAGAATPVGGQINACATGETVTAPAVGPLGAQQVNVGTYTSNGSVLFDGASLGLRMTNANGSGAGNDAAFDNIRVLDVTPQLDKSFSPATAFVNGTSTLTFTVTNTSELAAKAGWGFTDTLPDGLTVASNPNLGGTCTADRSATAGGTSIDVTNGNLPAGTESCTITVDVTSSQVGTYTNGPDNVTETGLNPPADTTVEFVVPPTFSCTSDAFLFQYPPTGAGPTSIRSVDMASGAWAEYASIDGRAINGVAYNPVDDYIYGYDSANSEFVRISADGTATGLGLPTGLAAPSRGINMGEFDDQGVFWVGSGGAGSTTLEWWSVNLGADAPFEMIDSGTQAMPVDGALADWAFSVADGELYTLARMTPSPETVLMRFDLETGELTNEGSLGTLTAPNGEIAQDAFGAVYADASGFIYGSNNSNGQIWRVDPATGDATFFAYGPPSALNDGARCFNAPIPVDFGDAPVGYGTELDEDGARHAIPGYDDVANTAPLMLGSSIDAETDGQPTADATGDDTNGVADEDGVTFNPDLGYGTPTLRSGLNPISLQPVENTLAVEASADGFASIWVDWNQDGAFSEDERVANAQPVTAGVNDVTFAQGENAAGIQTFVRVRYSTDAASIASPTGPAPDGEVEDYQVLIERLVQPDACTAGGTEYYALTFAAPTEATGTGGPGSSVRYANATVVNGVAVDMLAETLDGAMNPANAQPNGFTVGNGGVIGTDDAQWQINRGATIRYSFVEAGTDEPVNINGVLTVSDMDGATGAGPERATFNATDLAGFAVTTGSSVQIAEDADNITFTGVGNWNGDPESRFQVVIENLSSFDVQWDGGINSGFGFDGDGDLSIDPPACSDFGDAPDSYGTSLDADGARHLIVPGLTLGTEIDFDPDGQPTDDASGDDENRLADEDGVVDDITVYYGQETTVSVTATNNTGEPATLAGWIDLNVNGQFDAGERVTVAVPANSGTADYQLTFPEPTVYGDGTFARFRLFAGEVADPVPTGAATGGEVEDYAVAGPILPPFVCTSGADGFLFQYPTGPTLIQGVDMVTGEYETIQTIDGYAVNAVGYNVLDDYIYGWSATQPNPGIVRVGANGEVVTLGMPTGGTVASTVVGDVDADGQYWVLTDTTWSRIDLAPGSPTYMQLIDSGTTNATPNLQNPGFDWAYVPGAGDYLYSVGLNLDGQANLIRFDMATGNRSNLGSIGIGTATPWTFGAVYADANGYLYASDNGTGTIYRIDVQDVTGEIFSQGPASGSNDGARCASSPILLDFGDAPGTYSTSLGEDGPRHGIIGYDADTNTAPLMIGAMVDPEDDGQSNDAADGDDTNGAADEDGIASPIVVQVGEAPVITVSATNDTTEVATLAGWIDLNGDGTFEEGERVTVEVPANSGTAEYVLTFPAGTVTADTYARFRLFPGAVATPLPTGPAGAGEVEDHLVTVEDRELEIEKTSDMTADSRVGDEITYTITATNIGSGDFTDEFPAVVLDDLSGVLDDATYNNDAAVTASDASDVNDPSFIPASFLSWSGPLAAGESVEITYTVTLASGGDGAVRNVAWQPSTPPTPGTPPTDIPSCDPPEDGVDPVTGEACSFAEGELPRLSIEKTSDTVDLPADGGTVTYTVTVTNDGPGAFTDAAPATMTDDLSDVLDDATFGSITAPAAGASFDEAAQEVTWSGPLAAGASVEITYTVVYDATTGDNVLINTACVPADDATDPAANCDFVQIPAAALTMDKTVDPADGTTVVAGQEVTYTLSFTNTGQAAATVDALDTLTNVLDDATLTAGPDAADGLNAGITGDELVITGEVPVGETRTVTYTVTVNAYADQGDHTLGNVLSNGDGTCPPAGCEVTENPIRHYTVAKALADETPDTVNAGDVVTYAVTITNDGAADYTVDEPAAISDNLTAVLDDATYNADAIAEVDGAPSVVLPRPTFTEPSLDWAGPLAVGQTVTITYTVIVNDPLSGDGELTNTVAPTVPGGDCAPDECTTITDIQSYTVTKSASASTVVPGDTIAYTVTVSNTGNVDYTADAPASFTDDMSAVLDDATYNDDATNGATVDSATLSWSGALPAGGDPIVITYSVTVNDPNTGDNVLTNAVVPTGPGGICDPADSCETVTPVQSYSVAKSASSSTANPGDTVTYEVTVANTGGVDYTADAPASFTDDLSAVLDDATYNDDADSGATVTDATLTWSGALPVGESITITYSVTVNDPNTGDGELTNTVVPTGPGGDCTPEEECTTTTDVQSYTVSKTSSAESVQLGGTIEYTVTVTNTGNVDFTEDAPASFTDDLSAVLDDATYNDDATEGATVSGSTLAWSGALAAGDSVDITYSVTVNSPNTGDNVLTNAVVPDGPGGSCAPGEECITTTPVQSFTVTKTADATDVVPGDVITYTLTIENTGEAAYTQDSPASLTDDMTAVLDDATYNEDATNGATYDEPTLSWSGPLAIDEVVTITYSVTVNDPVTGDSQIDNAVVTENGGNCAPGSNDPDCVTNIPSGSYTVSKTASATTAMPGDVITYTVTVTNTGAIDYTEGEPASFDDNLANVLDDATYNDDATNGATVDGTMLSWEGPLGAGESIDIVYSVTVNPAGSGASDLNLGNIVVPTSPGGDCEPEEDCITNTPVGQFQVSKSSSGDGEVNEGDVLTYTITVTNDSEVDFTEDAPASFSDDLSAVLDDASYNDDASNGATVDGETLSWEGPLAAGASIEITYSVTVGAAGSGDGVLTNAVVPGNGGTCLVDCTTTDELQAYTVTKTSSAGGTTNVGDIVAYTVTITNTGAVDYTDDTPASFTDDLSAVLDDATYNGDATNGAIVSGGTLSWQGPLEAGASVEVTYSVTVLPTGSGDGVLTNAVVPNGPGGACDPEDSCTTTDELQAFAVEKSSSATVVNLGDTLTYTITVTNTGVAAFTEDSPAVITDDLSAVLDDATYNGDATNGAVYTAPVLSWELAIPAGESVTLTYSVDVNDPATGDLQLVNAVTPGDGGECVDGSCITETPIASYAVAKSVDTTNTGLGETVTYTITVTNTGAVDYTEENPASFDDDLSEVLDDATYNGDATNGATYREPMLSWAGALEVGATVTVTYSVIVNDPVSGDRQLVNAVVPGDGGSCGEACSTTTNVDVPGLPNLPATGLDPWVIGVGIGGALAALIGGLLLIAIRRRDSFVEAE
ncbi:GEVED domain-containing protein [Microbacterium sp.]|uniref:DUF7927 domain-containing protein n=1 Tax=Microbacterium sp. TaxID=51671 RepID=UPI002732E428|nr:GEVED domain-containing protein [Microbacterium sp.]MDP3951829.1 GEVED domain-containing protein [Microbacterium sp.]